MPSIEYETLTQSIAKLEANLLNFPVKLTEPYSEEDLLKCQAYVIFAHAEIQVYWETISRRILREAECRWNANQDVDRVIATLVAFRRDARVSIPANPAQPESGGDFTKMVESAIKAQQAVIADNNGIKRANLAHLLCPLGVLKHDFSETFLIQSDQTGKKRGDMVHKSSRVSLRSVRDPFTEEKVDIDNLVKEIALIDSKLENLNLLSSTPSHEGEPNPIQT